MKMFRFLILLFLININIFAEVDHFRVLEKYRGLSSEELKSRKKEVEKDLNNAIFKYIFTKSEIGKEALALTIGVDKDSEHFKKIIRGDFSTNKIKTNTKISKHIRGTEGIDFPTPLTKKDFLENKKKNLNMKKFNNTSLLDKPIDITKCIFNKTLIKPTAYKGTKSQVIRDILFLYHKDINVKSYIKYGKHTQIIGLDYGEKLNSQNHYAKSLGLNCIPSRMRLTNKSAYIHYGTDALKNFDKDPDGYGKDVLDLEIKKDTDEK